MLLQGGVQVVPQLGHPVQHAEEVLVGQVPLVLRLHQLPVEVAHQEAVGRLHVVGERHHPGFKWKEKVKLFVIHTEHNITQHALLTELRGRHHPGVPWKEGASL